MTIRDTPSSAFGDLQRNLGITLSALKLTPAAIARALREGGHKGPDKSLLLRWAAGDVRKPRDLANVAAVEAVLAVKGLLSPHQQFCEENPKIVALALRSEGVSVNIEKFSVYENIYDLFIPDLLNAKTLCRMTRLSEVIYATRNTPSSRDLMRKKVFDEGFSVQRIDIFYDIRALDAALHRAEIFRVKPENYRLRVLSAGQAFPILNLLTFDEEIIYLGAYSLTADPRQPSVRLEKKGLEKICGMLLNYYDTLWNSIPLEFQICDPLEITREAKQEITRSGHITAAQFDGIVDEIRRKRDV